MKNKITFDIRKKTFLGDVISPVQVYFNLRDKYPNSVLLESSDYNSQENSRSIICCESIAEFVVNKGVITQKLPFEEPIVNQVKNHDVYDFLEKFIHQFEPISNQDEINGLFGYSSYDSIPHFEKIDFNVPPNKLENIPEMRYHFYRFVIIFNHFNNEVTVLENLLSTEKNGKLVEMESAIKDMNFQTFPFEKVGETTSNLQDEEFKEMVRKGKEACFRGDVFQIVLSRQFQQRYKGDDFTLYRALRSINPSPYLFYFDYGDYRVFGSSPEAQIVIDQTKAEIHPIAGTFKRTGDISRDKELAEELLKDKKETAEHIMLVDLARNDLSRNCNEVTVENFKEVQYFSHVIHLVSKVTGKILENTNKMKLMMDTFPAGTLSGAPKYKAMQLIDQIENQQRGLYAGALGYIGFNGAVNQAIVIRSFVSQNQTLYFQAGAGIVHLSDEEKELQEVNNKLGALVKAISFAEKIGKK